MMSRMAVCKKQMLLLVAVLALGVAVFAVDRNNFKNCNESGFCKRQREVKSENAHYEVDTATIVITEDTVTMEVVDLGTAGVRLVLSVTGLAKNTARIHITEKAPLHPRYEVKDVIPEILEGRKLSEVEKSGDSVVYEFEGGNTVAISFKPFRIDLIKDSVAVMSVNSKGLFHFEHYRTKEDGDDPTMWEETYKSHKDTKPRGPSSVGIDISFPNFEHVYGIPEHATNLALKPTTEGDPYRLYNLDVFEYELNNPMALYGSIPYMLAHNEKQTVGVLFLNSAEMWIDVDATKATKGLFKHLSSWFSSSDEETSYVDTHWMAESGVIDLFVFMGPSANDVFAQYSALTGFSPLPPLFSIAYHQCRWNYNDEDDVAFVARSMDEHDIPMDVVWLDIEHTDGKRYFTWDSGKFPHPEVMQNNLAVSGRKMVNIVDPHIKRVGGFHIHEEAQKNGYYIKNKDGNEYDGHCWPGSSSWLDYMNPEIRSWWADQFAFNKYQGTTKHMYYWNDMNEPSVFNGPEVTMHKDAQHFGGWEHRDVHNIYGMWQQAATAEGIVKRSGGVERPFVLSRAFFAGSQRYGAIWTGDNTADWGHLKASTPMILSIGLAGLPFAGADIGGFFNNPDTELLVRWYQVGAYQPFMRAHAHLDTKRREPYLYEGNEKEIIRNAVRTRYELLPFYYTSFWETSTTGIPLIRPLWVQYPEDKETFAEEDSFFVGSDLLVVPATAAGVTSVSVYFPGSEPWYDVETYQTHTGPTRKQISAPLRKIPVFQRGGSIIPRKLRVRRSSDLMRNDPFTLIAVLDSQGSASGQLYIDDYHTFDYQKGKFSVRNFHVKKEGDVYEFKSTSNSTGSHETKEWVERIVIAGFPSSPSAVVVSTGEPLGFEYDTQKKVITIKKPSTSITQDFTVLISL